MWRRRAEPLQMAGRVETPTGNVRLTLPTPGLAGDDLIVSAEPRPSAGATVTAVGAASLTSTATSTAMPAGAATPGWSIRDGEGRIVASGLGSRAEALRNIGLIAVRGRCAPYELLDPTGRVTGDRLS